jgi:hypothetical protein
VILGSRGSTMNRPGAAGPAAVAAGVVASWPGSLTRALGSAGSGMPASMPGTTLPGIMVST